MFPLPRVPLSPGAPTVRTCFGTVPENRGLGAHCSGFASGPLHLLATRASKASEYSWSGCGLHKVLSREVE